jgi:threonine/homoserine/homoserine lactone efflux protein
MHLVGFLLEAASISLSGVLAPGPVTAVVVGKGSESPHAGALVALGHGIVEFPLIALVAWGIGTVFDAPVARTAIALVGGVLLVVMGIDMLRAARRTEVEARQSERYPLLAGILLSAGNPFFLIWWATVGATLVARSLEFGVGGVLALALTHWSCDLGWCYFLSALSFKGGQFFGKRFQQVVFVLCGVFLLFFGGRYVVGAVWELA